MRRLIADIFALHFGRADRWWAWAFVLALIGIVLVLRGGQQALISWVFWAWLIGFGLVSAIGVWWRRRGQKND